MSGEQYWILTIWVGGGTIYFVQMNFLNFGSLSCGGRSAARRRELWRFVRVKSWLRESTVSIKVGTVIVLLTAGCVSAPATPSAVVDTIVVTQLVPAATLVPLATYTPYPTYTPNPTYTAVPAVIVTATPLPATSTPARTSTATKPPMPTGLPPTTLPPTALPPTTIPPTAVPPTTLPPTAPPNKLTEAKGAGFYLVNLEIAPGLWRSQGNAKNCWVKTKTRTDDLIDIDLGPPGKTFYINANDFSVEFSVLEFGGASCLWNYMGQ